MEKIIQEPDLLVLVRIAGAQGLSEARLYQKKEDKMVVLLEEGKDGESQISSFEDLEAWLDWWTEGLAPERNESAANYIPPKVSLEEFLFALHAVDSFRRVTYQNMLDHEFSDKAYISVTEFLASMKTSLESLDIRWLLPAFLTVTPGLEQYRTEMDAPNMELLFSQGFFDQGKLASGEDVLVFGEAGQIMGAEFFRSWYTSCGLEIQVASPEGLHPVERIFLAPTLLGIHYARLESDGQDKGLVNHQLYTREQLVFKLSELFRDALNPDEAETVG